jgi:hypothetical protein
LYPIPRHYLNTEIRSALNAVCRPTALLAFPLGLNTANAGGGYADYCREIKLNGLTFCKIGKCAGGAEDETNIDPNACTGNSDDYLDVSTSVLLHKRHRSN